MNKLFFLPLVLLLPFFVHGDPPWLNNLIEAKEKARLEHKYVLLNFSGSDWCGPCIRMHREIFNTVEFQEVATKKLVLVNADFPRLKKNQLPASQQVMNEQMADQYNPKGYFPYTLLLDENGNVIKSWEGFFTEGPTAFRLLVDALTPPK